MKCCSSPGAPCKAIKKCPSHVPPLNFRSVAPNANSSLTTDNFIARFIINMVQAFQDRENLYLIMDLLTGGDLRFHINRHRKFTEEQTSKQRTRDPTSAPS